jgi:hypothetical protein
MRVWFRIMAGAAIVAAGTASGGASAASEVPAAKGSVVLTVAGKVENWNRGAMAADRDTLLNHHKISFDKAMAFDADMLAAMPLHELRVDAAGAETIFGGPLLTDVLKTAGANGGGVKLVALDGSVVELSAEEVKNRNWILALLVNGAKAGIGDFGPLWLLHKPDKGDAPSKEELQSWVSSVFYIEVN